ncbi:MAG: bifunctional phosphoribosylaminoimidazolecarboxamide formyltransferase/IMP cyclohydrolase [Bernardetiaceae bacterium]
MRTIHSALISVYHKDGLAPVVKKLHQLGITIYSTGGTQAFIAEQGVPVVAVEELTAYPSIFGGRVKTLHPKIFGGILQRRKHPEDTAEAAAYHIPAIDLVVVDLYPFEETVREGGTPEEIIEKIDIGGVSLIRAAAKNHQDTLVVASRKQYTSLLELLDAKGGVTEPRDRQEFATRAFAITSHYDTQIFHYFNRDVQLQTFKQSFVQSRWLRYGENPHQEALFYGDLGELFDQLNGKELSYNNLVDVDAAVALSDEFIQDERASFAILKHTNACGFALAETVAEAYQKALAADPVSAFGGVLITNRSIDLTAAEAMHDLFFEVLIAPDFSGEALALLQKKKKRILLRRKALLLPDRQFKTLLNGVIDQEKDTYAVVEEELKKVTQLQPTAEQIQDMLFADKLAKHAKSNTIVLAKDGQLFAAGVGQTSRVDALHQAITKARAFGFDLSAAVMASDAFFPFPDCVEIAHQAGIRAVIQPGGSIQDQASIDYCDTHGMTMVFTGFRHFKH